MSHDPFAVRQGLGQTPEEERPVDWLAITGKEPQRDLRCGAVMRYPDDPAFGIGHTDGFTGLGIATIGNVAREEPRMAAGRTIGSLAVDLNQIQGRAAI